MAFVRKRETPAGNLSTTLVEPYRDARGKPRQRVLANLFGCETPLDALAKLAGQRHRLRQEREQITAMLKEASEWAAAAVNIAADPAKARQLDLSAQEHRELWKLLNDRKKANARLKRIDSLLEQVKKHGSAIRKHVTASEQEIQQAIKAYQAELDLAEKKVAGATFMAWNAKREAAQLNLPGEAPKSADLPFFRDLMKGV